MMRKRGLILILLGMLALGACTQAQVAQTQAGVTAVCAVAPIVDPSQAVKIDANCAVEQSVEPVLAPLVPAMAP